jgi:hypothetical protein
VDKKAEIQLPGQLSGAGGASVGLAATNRQQKAADHERPSVRHFEAND